MRAMAMLTCLTATAVLAGGAHAQSQTRPSNWYADIGGGLAVEEDFDTIGVLARLGWQTQPPTVLSTLFDQIGGEGEFFYGLEGEEDQTSFGEFENKIEYLASGSFVGSRSLTNRIDAFARVGLSFASAEIDLSSQFDVFDDEETDTGLLLGLGGTFALTERGALRGDVTFQNDLEVFSLVFSQDF